MSSNATGAFGCSASSTSSSAWLSLPPERQTMMRSPAAIRSKSAIASPTCRRMRFASLPASYSRLRGSMRTAWTAMALDIDGAPAIHRDDLTGDIGGAGEEVYRLCDVLGTAHAGKRRGGNDALPFRRVELPVFRPRDRAGRHRVHAHGGRQLQCQRAGHRSQARLGDAVHRVALERPIGVDIDDID